MLELTVQQQQALDASPEPPRLVDPRTQQTYILLESAVYERLRTLLAEDGLDMRQVAVLVQQAMREDDAGDPSLEICQHDYGRRP
jgi:hypothetical protein